jgi:hypothetical protein
MGNLPRELLITCYVNSRGESIRSQFNRAPEMIEANKRLAQHLWAYRDNLFAWRRIE